jgi:hypothetical protein
MKVFLFGAGASAGTFPRIPVAKDFGAILHCRDGLKAFSAIKKAVRHLKLSENDFSLEDVWTAFDFYAKLHEALPHKPWNNESPEIKKAVLRIYGKRCDRLADRLPLKDNYTLGQLMKNEVRPGDLLVSFNYDTLIERLANKFSHKLCAAGHIGRRDAVLLSKPHGSASWTMNLKERKVIWHDNGSPLLNSLSEKKVKRKCEPLVLGTVPIKSELIREVQCNIPEIFDVVTKQWKALVDAIIKANTVVIVGYRFPPEDLYGRFMFKEAMRRRKKNLRLRIQYFELPDKASELCKEIVDVFGCKISRFEYMGKVEPHHPTNR